jgi:hypothetical protein
MRPVDIQPIGNELAIKCDDGGELSDTDLFARPKAR